ncbi:DUF4846 domain-containing protein [Flaviaesturariibacter amylovorans]|uniref:DUF4846 domain-containing protein n=1 Tax=Flaviaesturariibacter amylovorans TaxID=1084520 RepID=A0ABP8HSX4_9BACT
MLPARTALLTTVVLMTSCSGSGSAAPAMSAAVTDERSAKDDPTPGGSTVETRFAAPAGFTRSAAAPGSFGAYLRSLKLKPAGSPVHYYNGAIKGRHVHAAVVDLDVGTRDLQQCADAVMRLRAEWLYAQGQYDRIAFSFSDGFSAAYDKWRQGYRIGVRGNSAYWTKSAAPSTAYADFRKYLDAVYMYAGTLTLSRQLQQKPVAELAIGDVFIRGGSPGHAVIVVDVVEDARGGRRFLLAQSYMPAQEIHILKNPNSTDGSPWYDAGFGSVLETPEWDFRASELKTWPHE